MGHDKVRKCKIVFEANKIKTASKCIFRNENCMTDDDGPERHTRCRFPFKFNGSYSRGLDFLLSFEIIFVRGRPAKFTTRSRGLKNETGCTKKASYSIKCLFSLKDCYQRKTGPRNTEKC